MILGLEETSLFKKIKQLFKKWFQEQDVSVVNFVCELVSRCT